MFAAKTIRRALAFGSALLTTGALSIVGAAQPAAASSITLTGTVDCLNVNYSGATYDWFPWDLQLTTAPPSTTVRPSVSSVYPGYKFQFTRTLPSGTTYVSITALCSSGHSYDFSGSSSLPAIPAGTTAINANWGCSTAPVSPGPWVTTCTLQSVSFS